MTMKRKKLKKGVRSVLAVLCAAVLLYGGSRVFSSMNKKPEPAAAETPEPTPEPTPTPTPEPTPEPDKKISLFLTGDALIHESVYEDARNDDGTFDFAKQLDSVGNIASKYDLAYYNQETILGGSELGLSGYPTFNSPYEFGDYMVSKGFNLVSTANNHCLDKGLKGLENSYNYWKKQKGVIMQGTNLSQEDYDEIPVGECNGITYAFLSWCEHTNGIRAPYAYSVNYYPGHVEEIVNKVKKADGMADVVIVAMHWGTEYSHGINNDQKYLADELTKAGADIIIGNHPHDIEPFEWVNGKPVFYAMGNMIATQLDTDNQIGMVGALDITKKPDGEIVIDNVRADLIYTYTEGVYPALRYNVKTYLFSELTDEILPDHEALYEQYKNIITSVDNNIQIGGV
ncbi:MAG: CapA family protein [Solobacterium sp.]|nr:CapA family protein [Solobacterium sp.]